MTDREPPAPAGHTRSLNEAAAFFDEIDDLIEKSPKLSARAAALYEAAQGVPVTITLDMNEWGTIIAALIGMRSGTMSPTLEGVRAMDAVYQKVMQHLGPRVDALLPPEL